MKPRFELLEHTADIILLAHGATLDELFANAAYGMFSVIGEPDHAQLDRASPGCGTEREINVAGDDLESLLVAWLSELLFLFETTEIFFADFECRISGNQLTAMARGEKFNAEKHEFKTEIKAVTRHQLRVSQTEGEWQAKILLDL
jgi:SHS2 domain-containing protein